MSKFWIASAAVMALSGGMLFADTVTSGTGTFSAFPSGFGATTPIWQGNAGPLLTTAIPFWNNPSDDTGVGNSHDVNIGNVLTDSGGISGSPVLGSDTVTQQFANSDGSDPSAFNFVRNATSYNITLLYAQSGMNTGNNPMSGVVGSQIGYYVGSVNTPLYNVGQTFSPTGTQVFNPGVAGTSYGFYDYVCYAASSGVCTSFELYTTGNGNSGTFSNDTWDHFALFQLASGSYVIGFTGQNGIYGEGQGDFQDAVIELQAQAPEPGTVAIMGLGLAALGLLGRRRFAKK